ncbi:hypothetical protein [Acanthopleuribacter pedis]|uniref:DUF4351 domain-containing protein n=1 Tax=Acanthopleuribacter pedis TaxID=442870 RepID=A0A8J7U650_9BACT|nr:hypothetical protein [Acanthopleuribacter pedis]MBO1321524.1 hypothetical protein [Acanthopleuribacter pedis]
MSEFDNPWKHVAEDFFPELVAFFMPDAYREIDWEKPVESLDKDLPKEEVNDAVGDRRADKLFRVVTTDGDAQLVYLHIEFQNEVDEALSERMYIYNCRFFNKFRAPIVSLAILGDTNPDWRPEPFGFGKWGSILNFEFRIAKLMDYIAAREALESKENVIGLIVLAHLAGKLTRNRLDQRFQEKLAILKVLFAKEFDLKRFDRAIKFIDSVIDLPNEMDEPFREALQESVGEEKVAYLTSFERVAKEEGRVAGREEGRVAGREEGRVAGREEGRVEGASQMLLRILERKFGTNPPWVYEKMKTAKNAQVMMWVDKVLTADKLADVFA